MIGAVSFIRLISVSVIKTYYYKQSLFSNILIQCKYKMNEQTRYDETKSALWYIGIYTLYHENNFNFFFRTTIFNQHSVAAINT